MRVVVHPRHLLKGSALKLDVMTLAFVVMAENIKNAVAKMCNLININRHIFTLNKLA